MAQKVAFFAPSFAVRPLTTTALWRPCWHEYILLVPPPAKNTHHPFFETIPVFVPSLSWRNDQFSIRYRWLLKRRLPKPPRPRGRVVDSRIDPLIDNLSAASGIGDACVVQQDGSALSVPSLCVFLFWPERVLANGPLRDTKRRKGKPCLPTSVRLIVGAANPPDAAGTKPGWVAVMATTTCSAASPQRTVSCEKNDSWSLFPAFVPSLSW